MPVQRLTEIVATRTTAAQKSLYAEQAARDGMRLASWVRWCVERRLKEAANSPRPEARIACDC